MSEYHKIYYRKNKERIDNYNKEYYQKNKDKLKLYYKNYYHINKITLGKPATNKKYLRYKKNYESYYQRNRLKILEKAKKYYNSHKLERKIYSDKYYFCIKKNIITNRKCYPKIIKNENIKKTYKQIVLSFD